MTSRRRIAFRLASLCLVPLGGFLSLNALAQDEPVYFVDGARPAVGDLSQFVSEDEMLDRCVQYSADRPDVHVCGPVSNDWKPAPRPYFDQAICDAARDWLSVTKPNEDVDGASCFVDEGEGAMWDVIFIRSNESVVHVPYDTSGVVPWAVHP